MNKWKVSITGPVTEEVEADEVDVSFSGALLFYRRASRSSPGEGNPSLIAIRIFAPDRWNQVWEVPSGD